MSTPSDSPEASVGRNEPCPCGSGKKYKRCHGISAAPKLTTRAAPAMPSGGNPFENMNPDQMQSMTQMTQAIQRLPKGQMQRLQAIMQKAMSGKDVTREAQEFEKTLPLELQQMMRNFQMPGLPGMGGDAGGMPGLPGMGGLGGMGGDAIEVPGVPVGGMDDSSAMSAEDARRIVEEAAAKGEISADQAKDLLSATPGTDKESKLSKFFKFGKK